MGDIVKAIASFAAAIVLSAAPTFAPAATTITYAGTVFDRQGSGNQDQYFGAVVAGTSTYTLVYTVDETAGGTLSNPDAYSVRLGGAGSVTAVITINGISQIIGGANDSYVSATNAKPNAFNNPTDAVGQKSQDFTDSAILYRDVYAETTLSSYLNSFISTADFTSPFTYQLVSGDSFLSTFHINDVNRNTGIGSSIYLNLGLTSVTVATMPPATGGAVPEPATWAFMISGFAMVGGALRRRASSGVSLA